MISGGILPNLSLTIGILASAVVVISGTYGVFKKLQSSRRRRSTIQRQSPIVDPRIDEYLNHIRAQKSFFETWRILDFHVDIHMTDVYVQERLAEQPGASPLGSQRPRPAPILDSELFDHIRNDATGRPHIYIIEGKAGSGKSTLLGNWMLRILGGTDPARSSKSVTPLYLALRHLQAADQQPTAGALTIADLSACLRQTTPAVPADVATQLFEQLNSPVSISTDRTETTASGRKVDTRPPRWLLLLDGLDEMQPTLRPILFRWMQALPNTVRVVLTSRPNVFEPPVSPRNSVTYEICDFNDEQMSSFVTGWFHYNPDLGQSFRREIESKSALRKLATIPLLLTCLSIDVQVRDDSTFPDNIMEGVLLQRVIEIILDKWDARKADRQVDYKMIQLGTEVFTEIALEHNYGSKIGYDELKRRFEARAAKKRIPGASAREFLNRIASTGWILVGSMDTGYYFGHTIFFDYFYGMGLRDLVRGVSGPRTRKNLKS